MYLLGYKGGTSRKAQIFTGGYKINQTMKCWGDESLWTNICNETLLKNCPLKCQYTINLLYNSLHLSIIYLTTAISYRNFL